MDSRARCALVLTIGAGLALAATAPSAVRADVAPNGKVAYASNEDGDYDIYTVNADGSEATNLTDALGPADDLDPAWSPDGTRIAFVSNRRSDGIDVFVTDIFVIDANGSNPVPLTEAAPDEDNFGPSWSPDGSRIAFTSTRDGDWEIFTMGSDGSNQTNVTGPHQALPYDDWNPDWSPDGASIVFQGVREGAWEILRMNVDGTGETNLTAEDDPPYANTNDSPSYRPDGSKIVFASQPNDGSNEWDIWVMNPDGTGKENVLPDEEWEDLWPAWSPDGRQIIFASNRSEFGTDIFTIDYGPPAAANVAPPTAARQVAAIVAPATEVRQVTTNGSSTSPDWGPLPGTPTLLVEIDVKPGSIRNPVNLRSRGVVPVAVLSSADFDALNLAVATVCFGDAEDATQRDCTEKHRKGHPADVNGDGRTDLVLHFDTPEVGIDRGDSQACLTGETSSSRRVAGCDVVTPR